MNQIELFTRFRWPLRGTFFLYIQEMPGTILHSNLSCLVSLNFASNLGVFFIDFFASGLQ